MRIADMPGGAASSPNQCQPPTQCQNSRAMGAAEVISVAVVAFARICQLMGELLLLHYCSACRRRLFTCLSVRQITTRARGGPLR